MCEGGSLSPAFVLKAATSAAAECLGLEDVGRIAPGMCADLLGVRGNPLAAIGDIQKTALVVARGRLAS
jgi:imidazolonepropionase-like amidohydrolase